MRDYELLYIVPGDTSEEDATKATDQVNATLLKLGGKVQDENFWGRRKLAYPIAKQANGWYVVARFSLDPSKISEFRQALSLQSGLLRNLVLHADQLPSPEESTRIEAAVKEEEKANAETSRTTPETVKRTAPPVDKEPKTADKKAETAEEKKERQAKLEEKLSEILQDE